MDNGIPIIGKPPAPRKPLADAMQSSVLYHAAHKHLQASLAKLGSSGQFVLTFFPDGSFAFAPVGSATPVQLAEGAAALANFAAQQMLGVVQQFALAAARAQAQAEGAKIVKPN